MMRPHSISKPDRSEFQKMRQRLTVPVSSSRLERRKISKTINPSVSGEDNIVILYPENRHDDAEQEPVPNLESEARKGGQGCLEKIANSIRGAVLMRTLKWAPICVMPTAAITSINCVHIQGGAGGIEIPKSVNLEEALEALKDKEYVIAWAYFKDKNYPEDSKYIEYYQKAKKGVEGMAKYYLINARKLVKRKKPIQYRNYHQAIKDWKNAIRIRGKNHPNNKIVENEIQWAEGELASFEEEYKDQFNKLKKLLKEPNYEKEVWMDIIRTFERLRVLRLVLKKEDKSLTPLAIAYFDKFFEENHYERGNEAARMAIALKTEEISEKVKSRFATNYHLCEAEKNELLQKIETALNEGRKDVVREKAREILELNPDKSTVKRVKKVLAKINGKPKKKPSRKKRRRRRRKAKVAVSAIPGDTTPQKPSSPDEEKKKALLEKKLAAQQAAEDKREMTEALREISERFKKGEQFEAMVELNEVIANFAGSDQQKRAIALKKLWNPDRKRLIRETLKKANIAFLRKDHQSAKQYYQAVLDLDPKNATASKRFKFLSGLKLKISNGEPSEEQEE